MRSDKDKAQERDPEHDPHSPLDWMNVIRKDFAHLNDLLCYV